LLGIVFFFGKIPDDLEIYCSPTVPEFADLKPGFHMSGKSQMVWDFNFPDCPRFCRLMNTRNRRYPRSSGLNGDKSGESGAFLFSRRVPDFCDGRRSFPTNENSNVYRRGRRHPSPMDFAHYQSPKLLGSSLPITNIRIVSRKSGTDLWRISDISAKSGMVGKK